MARVVHARPAPIHLLLAAAVGCGTAGEASPTERDAVELRCDHFPPPGSDRVLAEDVGYAGVHVGPCGHVLVVGPDDVTVTAPSGGAAEVIADSVLDFAFAPEGDRLAFRTEGGLVVRDLATGEMRVLAEEPAGSYGWLRGGLAYACADGAVRVLDAEVRTVARDVSGCIAHAEHARVVVVRGTDGALRWIDVDTGEERVLADVPYHSERFAAEDLARDDVILLSPDGRALWHQESWRRPFAGFVPEDWATVWDTETGEALGVVRTDPADPALRPITLPGTGHVTVIASDGWMVVLDEDMRLVGYEGWDVVRQRPDRGVLAREVETNELHRIDPTPGISLGVVASHVMDASRVVLSDDGSAGAVPVAGDCEWHVAGGYCRTLSTLVRWRGRRTDELDLRLEGSPTIAWVGADGAMLVEGALRVGGVATQGTHLVGAGGTVLRTWPDRRPSSVHRAAATLLAVLHDPETGVSELRAVDLASGTDRTVAAARNGLELHVDDRARTMVWIAGTAIEEDGIFRLRRTVHVGPTP